MSKGNCKMRRYEERNEWKEAKMNNEYKMMSKNESKLITDWAEKKLH